MDMRLGEAHESETSEKRLRAEALLEHGGNNTFEPEAITASAGPEWSNPRRARWWWWWWWAIAEARIGFDAWLLAARAIAALGSRMAPDGMAPRGPVGSRAEKRRDARRAACWKRAGVRRSVRVHLRQSETASSACRGRTLLLPPCSRSHFPQAAGEARDRMTADRVRGAGVEIRSRRSKRARTLDAPLRKHRSLYISSSWRMCSAGRERGGFSLSNLLINALTLLRKPPPSTPQSFATRLPSQREHRHGRGLRASGLVRPTQKFHYTSIVAPVPLEA